MHFRMLRIGVLAATLAAVFCFGASARAEFIQITVASTQPAGGLAITPMWIGFSNGTFNSFDVGGNANGGPYESLAELGSTAALTTAFSGFGPQVTIGGGPILPGGSASTILNVANPVGSRFLNYASMIVPSNDLFIGNGNANPITIFNASGQLIDSGGNLAATRTITITGNMIWDAGTEVNNVQNGGAFVSGVDALLGTPENGTVQRLFGGPVDNSAYINSLVGTVTPAYTVTQPLTAGSPIATITFRVVPEPSTMTLAAIGLVTLGVARRGRRPLGRNRAACGAD